MTLLEISDGRVLFVAARFVMPHALKRLFQNFTNPGQPAGMAWLLAAATVALFAPALGCEFINYDDTLYAYQNPHVLNGLNLSSLAYAFRTADGGSWMPLTWVSYLLVTTLFGVNAAAQHALNVLLHAGSAALLFLALERMTRCFWRSALVAALFAFHPLRAESVVWVAERKDVLSTFFWMLGLLAYARHAEKPGARRMSPVFACLLLGLMAKPMLVTFPFALLLLDHWPLGRTGQNWRELRANFWPLLREKIPLLAVCTLAAGLALWSQKHIGAVVTVAAAPPLKALRVAENYAFYLQKIFWPSPLSLLYPTAILIYWHAAMAGVFLGGMMALAVRWMFRLPWLPTGWFWFLGTFLPVIGWVRLGHITVADRYTYIPSIGLALLFAWAAGFLVERRPAARRLAVAASVVLLASGAFATRANLPRWKNSVTILENAIAQGDNPIAYNNLAVAYNDRGDCARALNNFNRAIALNPDYAEAFINRALARKGLGDLDGARADLDHAIRLKPAAPEAFVNRGDLYYGNGDFNRAIHDFTTAIRLDPLHAKAWNNRASAFNSQGNFMAARVDTKQALQINPRYAEAWNNLGTARGSLGDPAGALAAYNRALEINPSLALAYNNRAGWFFQAGKFAEAWADIRHCRQLGGQPSAALVRDLATASGRTE